MAGATPAAQALTVRWLRGNIVIDLITSREFQLGMLTGVAGVALIYAVLFALGVVLKPWIMARATGVDITVRRLIGMHLRKTRPAIIVEAYVRDQKRGGQHSLDMLEAVYLAFKPDIDAGGDLVAITDRETQRAREQADRAT